MFYDNDIMSHDSSLNGVLFRFSAWYYFSTDNIGIEPLSSIVTFKFQKTVKRLRLYCFTLNLVHKSCQVFSYHVYLKTGLVVYTTLGL